MFAERRIHPRIDANKPGSLLSSEAPQKPAARCRGFGVSDGGRNSQLNFRARSGFTPNLQASTDKFCALTHARQAEVSATPVVENIRVHAFAIIAHPQQKLALAIDDFCFDLMRLCVLERIPQGLDGNPVSF